MQSDEEVAPKKTAMGLEHARQQDSENEQLLLMGETLKQNGHDAAVEAFVVAV